MSVYDRLCACLPCLSRYHTTETGIFYRTLFSNMIHGALDAFYDIGRRIRYKNASLYSYLTGFQDPADIGGIPNTSVISLEVILHNAFDSRSLFGFSWDKIIPGPRMWTEEYFQSRQVHGVRNPQRRRRSIWYSETFPSKAYRVPVGITIAINICI